MIIDIKKIPEGEESVIIRYRELSGKINKIIGILNDDDGKIWGRVDDENVCIETDELLYLESVDEKVFAYTKDKVVRLEGTLNSFMNSVNDDSFFRCAKSVVINVNRVSSLKSLSSNRIDATLESGEHIIISRRYASEFRRLLKGDR